MSFPALVALAAVLLSFQHPLRAGVILNNLGGSDNLVGARNVYPDQSWALGFTPSTTTEGEWSFKLRISDGATATPSTLVLQIFNTLPAENTPTVFALSTASRTIESGKTFYTYTGSGTLNSGSGYWLVASTSDFDSSYDWVDRGGYTTSGATFNGVQVNFGTGWGADPGNPDSFLSAEISVAPVPEPAHYALFAGLFLGACCVGHEVRKRRNLSRTL